MNGNAGFFIRIALALGLAAYALGLTDGGGGGESLHRQNHTLVQ